MQSRLGPPGGSIIEGIVHELEEELDVYFGAQNELRMGLNPKMVHKPVPLIFYEQQRDLKIPLVSGGVYDQPHIWLEQYITCQQREQLWMRIITNAKPAN